MREHTAYKAMVQFLEDRYDRLPFDALGGLLGELNSLPDGTPADPAVNAEWEQALAKADFEGINASGTLPIRRVG